jgi:UDP-N-acetylmuramyl pentapeptide phosphotransferase/UDP-N-acetylglucosamine-1-phosphate transferase
MQPDDFILFPKHLSPLLDKFAVIALIFIFSKGLGLLNGLGAIASLQFSAVMGAMGLLAYFGAIPQLLGVIAFAYFGVTIAFTFFSWPPEKIVISNGAFVALGFIMSCLMLSAATEFAEASIFIAASYIVTEIFVSFYNHFVIRDKSPNLSASTAYYKSSHNGEFESGVARGVLKILLIDIVLSLMQVAASERFALPFFAVMLNLWFLSILSGDTKPEELFSLSKFGKKAIKGLFSKKNTK